MTSRTYTAEHTKAFIYPCSHGLVGGGGSGPKSEDQYPLSGGIFSLLGDRWRKQPRHVGPMAYNYIGHP